MQSETARNEHRAEAIALVKAQKVYRCFLAAAWWQDRQTTS